MKTTYILYHISIQHKPTCVYLYNKDVYGTLDTVIYLLLPVSIGGLSVSGTFITKKYRGFYSYHIQDINTLEQYEQTFVLVEILRSIKTLFCRGFRGKQME